MKTDYQTDKFTKQLMFWFSKNKRELPWRQTTEPYKVWLSEIMLQQTRVEQAKVYFLRFVEAFPTIFDLAIGPEKKILKLWQGLGYYSRARNLHFTAKTIVNQFNGEFPNNKKELIQLKGIGEYTACAIASICFNENVAAVDGNFYRLLARYFGISMPIDTNEGKKHFSELANTLCPKKNAGDFNQAVMDFASIICKPKSPMCLDCIFNDSCIAFYEKTQNVLPVKAKKIKVIQRYFKYYFITDGNSFLYRKRKENDIWKGLIEFYLVEDKKNSWNDSRNKVKISNKEPVMLFAKKHLLSHQHIHAEFYYIKIEKLPILKGYSSAKNKNLHAFPVSRLTESFIESELFLKLLNNNNSK